MIIPSPFISVDRQNVLGTLKSAGTRDPDVLYARKANLLRSVKFPKLAGTYVIVMGIAASATILLAVIGIPMIIFGWWMRRRGVRNVATVEEVYTEFTKAPAV